MKRRCRTSRRKTEWNVKSALWEKWCELRAWSCSKTVWHISQPLNREMHPNWLNPFWYIYVVMYDLQVYFFFILPHMKQAPSDAKTAKWSSQSYIEIETTLLQPVSKLTANRKIWVWAQPCSFGFVWDQWHISMHYYRMRKITQQCMRRLNFRRLPFEQCTPHGLKPFQCITEGVHFFFLYYSCSTSKQTMPSQNAY